MKVFLDDERNPIGDDWFVCRSVYEFIYHCNLYGVPNHISFDHDLGHSLTGLDAVKFLISSELDGELTIPNNFSYYVHSQNPIGKKNIESLLDSYLSQKRRN